MTMQSKARLDWGIGRSIGEKIYSNDNSPEFAYLCHKGATRPH